MLRGAAVVAIAVALLAAGGAQAASPALRAGAGRADVTPPTGYYMFGWVRSDAQSTGQHTRLFARAIVLQRGRQKVALVTADLGGVAGGAVAEAARRNRDRGFSERNVIVSASHTHASPTQWFNFGAYNTVFMTAQQPSEFNTEADPQLYAFMVRRLALAIRRADDDLGPAAAGWGARDLLGLTQNRSIEAHLNDHGIVEDFGEGSVKQDPQGYPHTIDPNVQVLRVDKIRRNGRRVPIGTWSTFADHGTVNKFTFHVYNRDHHGSATEVVEKTIRRRGRVPGGQEVVNAYGNTDEGDQSAGLHRSGPAASDYVGRVEARRMLSAWEAAGRRMSRRPELGLRWTRVCFCGQETAVGPVDTMAQIGLPLLTGSEEGRGPLYDETHVPFEGRTSPVSAGPQGDKIAVNAPGDYPKAVPLAALRLGDRMIVTIPGEMTVDMGRRIRTAVLNQSRPSGVRRAVISGLANEYLQYFVTPEEYDRQHYEGGSMLYGRASSVLLKESLEALTRSLVLGRAAPKAYPYDPRNGLAATDPPFPSGAAKATPLRQPATTARFRRARFEWHGGQRGLDRPLDRAFVTIERRTAKGWRAYDSDLGLRTIWEVDDDGDYTALWEVPRNAPKGRYRFYVTGNRYGLHSRQFDVVASNALRLARVPGGVTLSYPKPVVERDLTYRPPIRRAFVSFTIRDGLAFVDSRGRRVIRVPKGALDVKARYAQDRWGNRNANALKLSP
ncbi:MAG TPA: neutral/alkaline non-lysosomal ceramidase N-terminal domain-containing protein [Thermoleophilaceae bacterium]|nr:neutral/alkaline non-lysosomal ceramidase N-terminal domain-containing protein [Thermoleophilaceae bacterium]